MIIIFPLQIEKVDLLFSKITSLNLEKGFFVPWQLIELERQNISGIEIATFALVCSEMPSQAGLEWDFDPIETVVPSPRYCPECLKENRFTCLPSQNKSGYCTQHREKNPDRIARKKSPRR